MSKRTVVAIEPSFDEGITVKLLKAQAEYADAKIPQPFDCDPEHMPSWAEAQAVKLHGQTIFSQLKSHPAIDSAIKNALLEQHGQVHALYFKIDVNDAERLLWEALCDDHGIFLALDRRWPIGRIADPPVDKPVVEYEFGPPLKITALLSAIGIDGHPEWESLREAVLQGRQGGLPINLQVFVGEQPLLDTIRDEIQQGLTGVEVFPLPVNPIEIEDALTEFSPHFVHFFCHGSTSHGVSELELATILDRAQMRPTGSIRLRIDQLANIPALENVWLITFNCCEGGRPTNDLHSLAHSLVASVVPVSIGCLEPISADDAHEFCKGFYPEVFNRLNQLLGGIDEDETKEFEWVEALRYPRTGLCQKHQNDPENNRQWALPVIYVRPETFRVKKVGVGCDRETSRDITERAEMIAAALRALPPDTPEQVRDRLLALVTNLPKELQPNSEGQFNDGD